jgi:hypothetical protein
MTGVPGVYDPGVALPDELTGVVVVAFDHQVHVDGVRGGEVG